MIKLNVNLSKEEILKVLRKEYRNLTDKQIVEKYQWLECPKAEKKVSPMQCMFCMQGHMTECHYPFHCDKAICRYYKRTINDNYVRWNRRPIPS